MSEETEHSKEIEPGTGHPSLPPVEPELPPDEAPEPPKPAEPEVTPGTEQKKTPR